MCSTAVMVRMLHRLTDMYGLVLIVLCGDEQLYMYQMLEGIAYCHSHRGFMAQ